MSQSNKPALERIAILENQNQRMVMIMSQGFGQIEARIAGLDEVLTAVVSLVGKKAVTEKIVELRKERRKTEIVKEKELLAKAVEYGILTKAEQISEESLIVGKEMNKDGTAGNPFVQVVYSTLLPNYQEKLLLKGIGTTVETPGNESTFEVIEIYQPAPGIELEGTDLEELIAEKETAATPPAPNGAGTETTPPEMPADPAEEEVIAPNPAATENTETKTE